MSDLVQVVLGLFICVMVMFGFSLYMAFMDAYEKASPFVIVGNKGRKRSFLERFLIGLGF